MKDDGKKVLFVCSANACRSVMAEAIAHHDASDVIVARSAGLEPIGYIPWMTKQTLKRNGYWLQGLESKCIRQEVWEWADIVINMSGHARERAFPDVSKVEDWKIEDPFGAEAKVYQRVFEDIRMQVAAFAHKCRKNISSVTVERRNFTRTQPALPMFINLNGDNEAAVLNIGEGGLSLAAGVGLPNRPLHNMRIQFLEFPPDLEADCRIAWRNDANTEAGIQFIGLKEEERLRIREWISAQGWPLSASRPTASIPEEGRQPQRVLAVPDLAFALPGSLPPRQGIDTPVLPSSPRLPRPVVGTGQVAAAIRKFERIGKQSTKDAFQYLSGLTRAQRKPRVWHQAWTIIVTAGFLIGVSSLIFGWTASQHVVRSEVVTAVKKGSEALSERGILKAIPPAARPTTDPNASAEKSKRESSLAEPPPKETARLAPDIVPKSSSPRASSGQKPLQSSAGKASNNAARTAARNTPSSSQSTHKSFIASARPVNIAPPRRPEQQTASAPSLIAPRLDTASPSAPNPLTMDARAAKPPEPAPTTAASPPAKSPVAPAEMTGEVSILADPYPSLRMPEGGWKKQRQGTSLELGHLVSRVEPIYPQEAIQQGIQGTVKLRAVIGRHGSVEKLESVNGSPVLAAAAMNAVNRWHYSETLVAGKSVETEQEIAIVFRLSNKER